MLFPTFFLSFSVSFNLSQLGEFRHERFGWLYRMV
jgi:hypothetical protein